MEGILAEENSIRFENIYSSSIYEQVYSFLAEDNIFLKVFRHILKKTGLKSSQIEVYEFPMQS